MISSSILQRRGVQLHRDPSEQALWNVVVMLVVESSVCGGIFFKYTVYVNCPYINIYIYTGHYVRIVEKLDSQSISANLIYET
jgi:uncharacterized protein (DUF1919 family)